MRWAVDPRPPNERPTYEKSGLAPALPRRQDGARPLDVARHFGLQRLQRIELEFVSDAGDDFDAHLVTINVAGEIKQVRLQQRRALIDRRPHAKTGDAVECSPVDARPHRV